MEHGPRTTRLALVGGMRSRLTHGHPFDGECGVVVSATTRIYPSTPATVIVPADLIGA